MRIRSFDPSPEVTAALYPRWNLGNRRREMSLALAAAHARREGRAYGYARHPEAKWTEDHACYVARLLLATCARIPNPAPPLPHVKLAIDWALAEPFVPPDAERCAQEIESYRERYGPGRGVAPRVLDPEWPAGMEAGPTSPS